MHKLSYLPTRKSGYIGHDLTSWPKPGSRDPGFMIEKSGEQIMEIIMVFNSNSYYIAIVNYGYYMDYFNYVHYGNLPRYNMI